jgi:hypothetical protein
VAVATPHQQFIAGLIASGWTILAVEPLVGARNPSKVHIRRGRVTHGLLVYAWRITPEGKGRAKAGRTDLDYRIQTTRSHDSPLQVIPGHVTLGIGWDDERQVFAAFDPWVKRFTGVSSSVHIHRALLDRAAGDQWAEERRDDGPEVAFQLAFIDRYLSWAFGDDRRPLFRLRPASFARTDGHATLVIDQSREHGASEVRPNDHVVVLDRAGRVMDLSVWSVEQIQDIDRQTASGQYHRVVLQFACRRIGVIRDAKGIEDLA